MLYFHDGSICSCQGPSVVVTNLGWLHTVFVKASCMLPMLVSWVSVLLWRALPISLLNSLERLRSGSLSIT